VIGAHGVFLELEEALQRDSAVIWLECIDESLIAQHKLGIKLPFPRAGVEVTRRRAVLTHMSAWRFFLCSESTALISRSVQSSLNSGSKKNPENLSSAPSSASAETSKKYVVEVMAVQAFEPPLCELR
jgi:hypothetical protein